MPALVVVLVLNLAEHMVPLAKQAMLLVVVDHVVRLDMLVLTLVMVALAERDDRLNLMVRLSFPTDWDHSDELVNVDNELLDSWT